MGLLACVNPFGILQDFLAECFYEYGLFISKHPRAFALGPLILTCILALGAFNVRMEDDLRFLYSPEHSRSRLEYQVHKNFTGASSNKVAENKRSMFLTEDTDAAPENEKRRLD
ncbi:hypothetical protein RB195_012058 [Necator americanus]|uniref:Uncharacterized protein n=1 Tax=Necator americanus TaxID=51031 RepID=A0ABR1D6M1_NECAM